MGTLPERSGTSGRSLAGQCGATLLYVIGAIVLLGGIAAALAVMSPSTTQSKLEQEAGDRAFYNAQSGLNFIYSMAAAYKANGESINAFFNDYGGNGNLITYNLPGNGSFCYRLAVNSINSIDSNSGTFDISYLMGTVGSGQTTKYAYLLYGGDRGSKNTIDYTLNHTILSSPYDTISDSMVSDTSQYKNDGTVKGTNSSAVTVAQGVVNNALYFNCGLYGRVVYPGIDAYNIYYSGSISLWFKAINFNNYNAGLLHKGSSSISCQSQTSNIYIFSDEVYTLQFLPSGNSTNKVNLIFTIIDGNQNTNCPSNRNQQACLCRGSTSWKAKTITSSKVFTNQNDAGVWYNVVATWYYDATTTTTYLKIYINGKLDTELQETPFTPRTNSAPIIVGSQVDANTNQDYTSFCGYIDDVNVYNVPLSAAAIKAAYCAVEPKDSYCQ